MTEIVIKLDSSVYKCCVCVENIIGSIKGYLKSIEGKDLSDFRYYHNGIVNGKFV